MLHDLAKDDGYVALSSQQQRIEKDGEIQQILPNYRIFH